MTLHFYINLREEDLHICTQAAIHTFEMWLILSESGDWHAKHLRWSQGDTNGACCVQWHQVESKHHLTGASY